VVRRLAGAGHEVVVFHRGLTAPDLPEGVGRIRGDRKDLESFAGKVRSIASEVVLDMIPMNEDEARNLVGVCEGVSRQVVAVSSQDAALAGMSR
jgi:hypothetical protein